MFDPTRVHEWLTRTAERLPDKEALICGDLRLTYREADERSTAVAHGLVALGVRRHDRVLIFLDNSVETVIAFYGILKAGATASVLVATLKPPKLRYILDNSGASVLIAHVSKARVVRSALEGWADPCRLVWVGDAARVPPDLDGVSSAWSDLLSSNASQPLPRVISQDLAALIYTSGSTGEPKGVMTTHATMLSGARSICIYLENREDDVVLNILPLSFNYGLFQIVMTFMFGGTMVLENSFLYLHQVLRRIGEEKITGWPIVPTMVAMLLKLDDLSKYDFSSLRYLSNTSAALPLEHIRLLRETFPNAHIYSMFGLTECKRVSYLPPEEIDRCPESVGVPMEDCEVYIVDADGNEVPPGEPGELVVRGANVTRGYWRNPEATARTFRPGRIPGEMFVHTGDLFRRDENGFLYFVGRPGDLIKTRGERVSIREVENVIHSAEGVAEAAALAVPDEILGQAIVVFVVAKPGVALSTDAVLAHCKRNMEAFAVPHTMEIVPSIPKTHNGKVDKKALLARLQASTETAGKGEIQ